MTEIPDSSPARQMWLRVCSRRTLRQSITKMWSKLNPRPSYVRYEHSEVTDPSGPGTG